MIIETLSTFPNMYDSVMGSSMMRIAQEKGILQFKAHDLRDWTHDRHRTTDDEPYGGGDGLVMKCEPIFEAYDDICSSAIGLKDTKSLKQSSFEKRATGTFSSCGTRFVGTSKPNDVHADIDAMENQGSEAEICTTGHAVAASAKPYTIFLAPQGKRFDDALASDLAQKDHLLFICGHYEGIDERAYTLADEVISLGDYVLTSGELASMVVIDAVVRKVPGVLGAETGAVGESFADGLLEYPQYTRPANFRGMEVPAVLRSGDHGKVDIWRRRQSLERTARWRPDLLESAPLSESDAAFLSSLSLSSNE